MNDEAGVAQDVADDVRRFVGSISTELARHPDLHALPYPEVRRIMEQVRAPWARGGPEMARTVEVMAPTRTGPVRVRIGYPKDADAQSALVYLHGGGWTMFSLDTHDRVMREYAARANVAAIGIDYALSPEAKFPVALHQIVDVVCWIVTGGCSGIDPERVAIGGDSAGANLAVAAALSLRDAGNGDAIKAMVLNYGAFSDQCSETARRRYGGPGYMLGGEEMDVFWGNYMRDAADAGNPLVCPLLADLECLPPAFFTIPECDLLTEQNHAMASRLRAAGVPVEAVEYEGATHSFLEAVSVAGVSSRAFADAAAWLRGVFGDAA